MRSNNLPRLAGLGISAFLFLATVPATFAATDEAIEDSITAGIAWLAGAQNSDGSWGTYYHTGQTCFALIKLQDRAYELIDPSTGEHFTSPFDPDYAYATNILAGWRYVLQAPRTAPMSLVTQSSGDPDTTGNGYGVYFMSNGDYHHRTYVTGICMMALAATGNPDRPNETGLDFDGDLVADTYGQLMQEAVDWLSFAQTDVGTGRGGWDYDFHNNSGSRSDNSISGYAVLGLAAAQNFGATVPLFVKDELNIWIDYIQHTNGASGYTAPTSWQNVLKTGNLLFEMKFVGDDPTASTRFQDALAYIEAMWRHATNDPGWGFNRYPADYQAMFALMKGLEFSGVELIDTDGDSVRDNDWFNQEPTSTPSQDFASVLVDQQNANGSWPACNWGSIQLCTTWALLTLEKITPVADPFKIAVEKDYRYTAVCFERDNDLDGEFNEDPVNFDLAGFAIDDDFDGLFNEDAIDCDPSDTGYMLPISGVDPEAFVLEAVLKRNGSVLNYNPGQYYAVSTVVVTRLDPSVESAVLTILEDFEDCTVGDYPLSVLNPKYGGGSVVVVEVVDGVAYQIYDATSDVVSIDRDLGDVETSATASFEYTFDEGQDEATLLVYVKFRPGLKGTEFAAVPDTMCENTNSGMLEVFEQGEIDPIFTANETAAAWLKVVEK